MSITQPAESPDTPHARRRAAHHEGGRRRGPRPRGHVALLAPPRVRPTQLPCRSKRPLLARRVLHWLEQQSNDPQAAR